MFECLLLTLSETGFPKRLFEEYLPILGPTHGLGCLGVFQALYVIRYPIDEEADIQNRCSSPLPLLRALPSGLKLVVVHHRLFQHNCRKLERLVPRDEADQKGLIFRSKSKPKRLIFSWENASTL